MAQLSTGDPVEKFRPTSGRVTGIVAVVLAVAIAVIGIVDRGEGFPVEVVAGAVLGGVLAWASMLRPALWLTPTDLVMRNMLETVHLPLAAIEEMAVRQVLAVSAGDRRYVSTAVGKSWRKSLKSSVPGGREPEGDRRVTDLPYVDFVEQRLRQRVDDAREAAGVRRGSGEQLALAAGVRRERAWLPIGLIAAAALAFLVTLLV
jgi:hypothetical protein